MDINEKSKQQQPEKEGFEYIDVLLENLEQRRPFAIEQGSSIHL